MPDSVHFIVTEKLIQESSPNMGQYLSSTARGKMSVLRYESDRLALGACRGSSFPMPNDLWSST